MSRIFAGTGGLQVIPNKDGVLDLEATNNITVNTTGAFVIPVGTTQQRPITGIKAGSLRFNTDTAAIEVYTMAGNWVTTTLKATATWTSGEGTLATIYDASRTNYSVNAVATTPSGSITYALVSGSLPPSMTLNTSTGAISGTTTAVASDATYTFTLSATNQSGIAVNRTFNIIVKAPISTTFNHTGSIQSFTVPTGITKVRATMWGAGGGGGTAGGWSYGAPGGAGGYSTGIITVNPSDTLYIVVGGGGQVNSSTSAYGGGGIANRSGSDNRYGSGGGGYSGVFTASTPSQVAALIIAGGGGGGGSSRAGTSNQGGAGGGTTGEDGYSPYDSKTGYRGRGGTQSAAGADASCDSANASGFQAALLGGTCRVNGYGGAGGGGYWGGSAGGYSESNTMGGGGGGSGYLHPTLVASGTLTVGSATTPANSADALRQNAGNAGAVGTAGSNGIVIISY